MHDPSEQRHQRPSGARSRRKGARFERSMVHRFREVFGDAHVRRGLQMRSGQEVPDIEAPGLWIEAKRHKRTNLRAALRQAVDNAPAGRMPLAVCKDDRADPVVILQLDDFLELLRPWWEARCR